MALPSTGGTYADLLQPGINQRAIRKMIVTDILIRDYLNTDGTVRSLADADVGLDSDGYFSPFAADGKLRDDLITDLGFYHIGSLDEGGIEMTYDTSVDETMIAQSKRAVRFDVTSDNDSITIKAMESSPLIDALRFDLALADLPDIGETGYRVLKPAESTLIERQVIALGFDADHYVGQTYPRMALKNRGGSNWSKSDPDIMEVELGSLLCPYVGIPVLLHREGSSWRGLQGAPVFPGAIPAATATSGQTATVAFTLPTSLSSTFTYVVEKSNTGTSGWTTATQTGSAGTSTITITVSGITTSSTWYFRVKATGTNDITTTSSNSNSIVGIS